MTKMEQMESTTMEGNRKYKILRIDLLVHGPVEEISFACAKIVSKKEGADTPDVDYSVISGPLSLKDRVLRYSGSAFFYGNFDDYKLYLCARLAKQAGLSRPLDPARFDWRLVEDIIDGGAGDPPIDLLHYEEE
jgi:hypothetical protein